MLNCGVCQHFLLYRLGAAFEVRHSCEEYQSRDIAYAIAGERDSDDRAYGEYRGRSSRSDRALAFKRAYAMFPIVG